MNIDQYFHHIDRHVHEAYDLANAARALGYDPEDIVAVPLAKNMAERVVGLISVVAPQIKDCGVDVRIRSLEEQYGVQDWRVALTIALEVAQQKFCSFQNQHQAMEVGIRTGIAYVTNGVVSSPLEGFTKLDLRKRRDGQPYAALYFSGPIRSAGGTGASVSVLIGDYVVRHFGCQPYDPTDEEVKRTVTELYDYHERITNLQYLPSEEEIQYMVTHLPVQIEGDPSEKIDVSNYKGLDRINTDKIRNGPCLVLGEGICQKAAKLNKQLSKWGENFGLGHWAFLQDFITLQKKIKAKLVKVQEDSSLLKPDYTFIKDIVAGRPVLTHPLARGGFRLRYGRCRTSGFSTDAIHPATMVVLNNYIAIGTQLKTERPGKSTVIASCDSLEGPIVKLANGNVLRLETVDQAKHVVKEIEEIIHLGDILINHGDFLDRAQPLVPAGYCEEWWALELEKALIEKKLAPLPLDHARITLFVQQPFSTIPSFAEALALTLALEIPLHPRYTYHWNEITADQFRAIHTLLTTKASVTDEKIIFPLKTQDLASDGIKRALELLGVPHTYVSHEYVVIAGVWAQALFHSFQQPCLDASTPLAMINPALHLRDKSGTTIGARMGRPEKAKMRKLTGSPQVLFPVGKQGGRLRSFQAALEQGKVTGEFSLYLCPTCNTETVYRICEMCKTRTIKKYFCRTCGITDKQQCHGDSLSYKRFEIDIRRYMTSALQLANIKQLPELIKGVRGTSNEDHTPEHLVKGILRAHHHIYANKDGTTRYDMTEMPLTHFKPKEVGTSIEKLKELGYLHDIQGQDLVSEEQILEIKPQDVILPHAEESLEAGAQDVLYHVANFLDDLLIHLYQQRPYYSLKKPSELVGHLVVALSPHTSAGIVGRIIGFSKTQGFLTHPSFHSIMRRDCFSSDTFIPLCVDGVWSNIRIGDYVEELQPTETVDAFGTLAKKVRNISTLGYNPQTNKTTVVPVREFTKHTPIPMYLLKTQDGRSLKVTENHKFLVLRNHFRFTVRASALQLGDQLITPFSYNLPSLILQSINLEAYYSTAPRVFLRGISDFIRSLVSAVGITDLAKKVNIARKNIAQYLLRNSFPLSLVSYLLSANHLTFEDLPEKRYIGLARDRPSLPPKIILCEDVLWLIGLYVAEGYARKNVSVKGYYQVDFAASEEEIRVRIEQTMNTYFNLKPSYVNKDRLTYSSHILYDFFVEILQTGNNAHNKRIPLQILNLPCEQLRFFLQGYFDGDGSVSLSDCRVQCDSVSIGLINDLEFVLRKYSIFTKRVFYTKKPGPKVRDFYIKKHRDIPVFSIHRLVVLSNFCHIFLSQIGFGLSRKQTILTRVVSQTRPYGTTIEHDTHFAYPTITSLEPCAAEPSYCLNVDHHFVVANGLMTYNCDGDEACVMLLMDLFLNFSRKYLPTHRGSTQDAPLVLTSKLIPKEVDDMVFNMDVAWKYPLALYEAALQYKAPWEVDIDRMGKHLGTPREYEGFGFTHDTSDLNFGARCSAYKYLPTMAEKLHGQMLLAEKIRAVEADAVAALVIERHFIRDIRGNLTKFSKQQFRCVACNEKFRRPPLAGKCSKCDGKIIFTISEGSIVKYLQPSIDLIKKYHVSPYLKQNIELTQMRIESLFGKEAEKQEGLGKWFG